MIIFPLFVEVMYTAEFYHKLFKRSIETFLEIEMNLCIGSQRINIAVNRGIIARPISNPIRQLNLGQLAGRQLADGQLADG